MSELIKCPDCDKTFTSVRALGPHRNKAHGYRVSDGKNNLKRAQGRDDKLPPIKRLAGKFPCPHCAFVAKWQGGLSKHIGAVHPDKEQPLSPRTLRRHASSGPHQCPECERSFAAATALGIHRRQAHGVIGTSKSAIKTRNQRGTELAKANQNAVTVAANNGHVTTPTQDDHRVEAAATYASGRVVQLLESLSLQFDVSFRAFAPLVLRTVGETTKVRL